MKKTTLLLAHLLARRASLWTTLGLFAALAFGPPPARAAVTEAWVHRYNGPADSYDSASAVTVDGSGNVVVTGISQVDYYTAKYAATDGALLWEQSSAGPENYEGEAHAVAVDGSGNVVVTGYSVGTNFNADYYTAKYAAADGTLLWEQRYNGPADSYDSASAVAVDGSGNVVVTGTSYSDYYTAKYAAADGALLWEKHYTANGFARAVAVDGSGNVVVTGQSYVDYYTAKYAAADGALLWEKRSTNGSASAVAVDGSGNVVVTGSSYVEPCGCFDYFYTVKYAAANGALLWEQRSTTGGRASAVAVDGSGNVVVTGSSFYTAKYAATDGALLWEKRYPGDSASAVAVDDSGNVVVTGSSGGDYYTAKYAAADGALLWEQRYNGSSNGWDYASSLALGPNGMVAVTGTSSGDYATVVYRDDVYPISIALVPGGVRLRFTGIPGRSYTIERAPAVTGPWSTVATPSAPASGLIEYLDAPPPPGSAFYRTVQP
jgi:CTP:phosphocholine cytidylyltransferase-like protein